MTDHTVIICRDKANSGALRQATRPAHLDWIRKAPFPVSAAGPLLAEDGQTMIGSLLVVQSGDITAVRDWAAGDPYVLAGLFDAVTMNPWKHLIGPGLPPGAAETPAP